MPCTSPDYTPDELAAERKARDIAERLACEFCRQLETLKLPVPRYACDWWGKHKSWDERRRREEQKERVDEEFRKKALSKLSSEERKALGFK